MFLEGDGGLYFATELGVLNAALSWFKNYLTNRFHHIKYQGKFSWKIMLGLRLMCWHNQKNNRSPIL